MVLPRPFGAVTGCIRQPRAHLGPHVLGGPKLLRYLCWWTWSSWPAARHAAHRWAGGPEARLAQSAERKALNLVVVGSSPTVGVGTHDACSCASVTAAVVHLETHSLFGGAPKAVRCRSWLHPAAARPLGATRVGWIQVLRHLCWWIWSSWPAAGHSPHCWADGPEARLAQSAERKALNLVAVGSSPTVGVESHKACSCANQYWSVVT